MNHQVPVGRNGYLGKGSHQQELQLRVQNNLKVALLFPVSMMIPCDGAFSVGVPQICERSPSFCFFSWPCSGDHARPSFYLLEWPLTSLEPSRVVTITRLFSLNCWSIEFCPIWFVAYYIREANTVQEKKQDRKISQPKPLSVSTVTDFLLVNLVKTLYC